MAGTLAVAGCYAHHERPGSNGPDSAIVIDAGTDASPGIDSGTDAAPVIDSAVVDAAQDAPADATPDVFVPDGCRAPGQDVLVTGGPDAIAIVGDHALEQLRGYRVIDGSLRISEVTSLDPLSCLERIGWLNIFDAPDLHSLGGLERLTAADGFQLDHTSVASLLPLRQMNTRQLSLWGNPQITTLDGLTLTDVDHLALRNLDNLVDIRALTGLTEVGYLELFVLTALTDLSALASLRAIKDNFWVDTVGMTTLRLPVLRTIDGFLGIVRCRDLRSIEMPSLERVIARPLGQHSYGIGIQGNPMLPQCYADNLQRQVEHVECQCSGNNGVGMCP